MKVFVEKMVEVEECQISVIMTADEALLLKNLLGPMGPRQVRSFLYEQYISKEGLDDTVDKIMTMLYELYIRLL